MSEQRQQERKGKMLAFATIGARTELGGCVSSGSRGTYFGLALARVGDVATYRDGSESVIVDGTGFAAQIDHMPVALVGGMLSNGDVVHDSPHRDVRMSTIFVPINEQGVALTLQERGTS